MSMCHFLAAWNAVFCEVESGCLGFCTCVSLSKVRLFKLPIRLDVGHVLQVEKLPKETLLNAAKTSMSSKIIGTESDYFAKIVSAGPGCYYILFAK
jgi:hypothetical protein